ncbi:glycoside hydrolase family 95 protein [Aurantibacter crassamenti]|uniref:glycoside hydrolase family 95 protein n=1 Tax=Aurantibacter crassamenti TaxID=1837375 RepID=UPI00193A0312|nr:glycoside hydrolase family 95 protein [Aurantibacter crassamenti]MBM1105468.1 glycoside hydrolase family 95 protein [Aurantibacter crassamenti]
MIQHLIKSIGSLLGVFKAKKIVFTKWKVPCVYSIMVIVFLIVSCSKKQAKFETTGSNEKLWYSYPAEYWNSQSLHLGNGYFGASFFGGVNTEKFSLTDASMWTGEPANGRWEKAGINPDAKKFLPKIRNAVVNNNGKLADELVENHFFGSSELFGHFTSIGDLIIQMNHKKDSVKNYKRTLDISQSIGGINYTIGEVDFQREYFCSYPDRVLAMKYSASKPKNVSFALGMKILQDSSSIKINENEYSLRGYINGNNRPFEVRMKIINYGGELGQDAHRLTLKNADSAYVYVTMATNYKMEYPHYKGEDPLGITKNVINKAFAKGYPKIKEDHIRDYKNLYDRVELKLETDKALDTLPTNERFTRLRNGEKDLGYKTLMFNLGRYLIISSSRPNTLPANLQGVWNAFYIAPWAGNYQANINLQEIYWSTGPTNLIECQEPYVDWIEDLVKPGKEVAQKIYGTSGWISHTTANIWGHAAPTGSLPWGLYPMGSAWHSQHIWDHYSFTQDKEYLKNRGYPILKEASQFWLENLTEFKGYLISAPTVSAEHGAMQTKNGLDTSQHDSISDKYIYSLPGVQQDVQMIRELFSMTEKAAIILGDSAFAQKIKAKSTKLLPHQIGKYGQLQEWYDDIDSPNGHHRHIPHLYAVIPGTQISPFNTPELASAAKKSLNMRGDGRYLNQELASGGNWARAHRMWAWVRLYDGNRANKILTELLTEQGFENGLTFQHADYDMGRPNYYTEDGLYLHFQLDASASLPGCIAEMLLQSHLGELHILPALADEFHTGEIKGLKARGNYTIDLKWKNSEVEHVTITCPNRNDIPPIRIKDKLVNHKDLDYITVIFDK